MSNLFRVLLNSCTGIGHRVLAQPCYLCGARHHGQLLCPACSDDLPRLPAGRCPICAAPTPGGEPCGACIRRPPRFDRAAAAYRYDFPLSVLVRQLKYGGELALAPWLADRLAAEIESAAGGGGALLPDLVIPMPLHENRLRERGFNQAALIAGRLASRLGIPPALHACRRVKDTRPQVELPFKARRGNMRSAFACDLDLTGRRVALVDDVMTSGASLDELAGVVKQAGALAVSAWVVARTVRG